MSRSTKMSDPGGLLGDLAHLLHHVLVPDATWAASAEPSPTVAAAMRLAGSVVSQLRLCHDEDGRVPDEVSRPVLELLDGFTRGVHAWAADEAKAGGSQSSGSSGSLPEASFCVVTVLLDVVLGGGGGAVGAVAPPLSHERPPADSVVLGAAILGRMHFAHCNLPLHAPLVEWIVTLLSIDAAAVGAAMHDGHRAGAAYTHGGRDSSSRALPFLEFLSCFSTAPAAADPCGTDLPHTAQSTFLLECLGNILGRAEQDDELLGTVGRHDGVLTALYHGIASEHAAFKRAAEDVLGRLFAGMWAPQDEGVGVAGRGDAGLIVLVPHYIQGCLACFPAQCTVLQLARNVGHVLQILDWTDRPPGDPGARRRALQASSVALWCLGRLRDRVLLDRSLSADHAEQLCLILFHALKTVPLVVIPAACEIIRSVVWAASSSASASQSGPPVEGSGMGVPYSTLVSLLQHAILSQEDPMRRERSLRWFLASSACAFAAPRARLASRL